MTTESQNAWAQYLEDASQREIRQMAEFAIDHLDDVEELKDLRRYVAEVIGAS